MSDPWHLYQEELMARNGSIPHGPGPAVAVIRPQTGDGDPLRRADHAGINVGPYLLAPILSHISYDLYHDLDRMLL
jgi:hypothetical protein